MTLKKYRLTALLVLVSVLCFIAIYSQYRGYWEDSATTDVPTAGPMQEAIEKTTGQLSYACEQWMKSKDRHEITDSTLSTSPCQEESRPFTRVILSY